MLKHSIQGSTDFGPILQYFEQNKINKQILSKIFLVNLDRDNKNRLTTLPYMGKTIDERNLSLSPGLDSLLPYFVFLKYNKVEDVSENLRKLLVIAGVIISQVTENSDSKNLASFPANLGFILQDLQTKFKGKKTLKSMMQKSSLKQFPLNQAFQNNEIISPVISNLLFLIYENCVNLHLK